VIALASGLWAPAVQAAVSADSVGVYSEELDADGVDAAAAGDAQRGAGVGLVRQPFSWARIETAPGRMDLAAYDGVMVAAARAGLAVLPVLMDPPPWRSTAPLAGRLHGMYPPRDPAAMAVLATALVDRYGPGGSLWAAHPELVPSPIHSWQVWNEPNIGAFWASGPDPVAYVRLLDAVGSAIRAADPSAEIVAAGLPYAENGLPIAAFVDGMYAAGARGTFDTLAIHPYASDPAGVLAILRAVREQLDRLGDRDLPIWATEFGWATGGPPVTITASERTQATLVHDAIVLMQRARGALHLRGFVAFRWSDVALNPGQTDVWALHTGLVREDGSAKPALGAFGAAVALWRQEPTPAQSASPPEMQDSPLVAGQPPAVAGVRRRVLRIRRFVVHGRLFVRVDVPPGGGNRRVAISYEALRGGRVAVRRRRLVGTRLRVARAVFRLPRHARSAQLLRITATHGSARATRLLRLHPRRSAGVAQRR
jgi:hypothetical protein